MVDIINARRTFTCKGLPNEAGPDILHQVTTTQMLKAEMWQSGACKSYIQEQDLQLQAGHHCDSYRQ